MDGLERSKNIVISEGKIPVSAYQAIYHKLTQNTESQSITRYGAFRFSANDLEDLHRQLTQTIQQYKVEAQSESISILFSDRELEKYSSFSRFSFANFRTRKSKTQSLIYEFDFLVILPVELIEIPDIAQRYKVTFKILRSTDLADADYPRQFFDDSIHRYKDSVELKIEFTDKIVANSLQNTLEKWIDTICIKENERQSLSILLLNYIVKKAELILPISVLIGSIIFDPSLVNKEWFTPHRFLLFVIVMAIVSSLAAGKFTDIFAKFAMRMNIRSKFDFTQGDKDFSDNLKDRSEGARKFLAIIFIAIILSSVVSIFSNWVYGKLLTWL